MTELSDADYALLVRNVQIAEERSESAKRMQKDYAVFVSYSHADADAARRVCDVLTQVRAEYRIDQKGLDLGDRILAKVRVLIAECTHYLLILSAQSVKSDWCKAEHGIAVGMGKTVIFFQADAVTAIPSWADPFLGTSQLPVLADYFGRCLIDPQAVERLALEILEEQRRRITSLRPSPDPPRRGSEPIGRSCQREDGEIEVDPHAPSVADSLSMDVHRWKPVYGWGASRSFWRQTVAALRRMLPAA